MARKRAKPEIAAASAYDGLLGRVSALLEEGRRTTVRTTNAILTATYWEVGGRSWSTSKVARQRPNTAKSCSNALART
jgi:hypothetical protein